VGRFQGKGSAKAPFFGLDEIVSMKWSWGYRGEQERFPDCRSSGQLARAWSGAGGEAILQVLRVGSGRHDSPLIGFSADAMTASNPRRVGLHEVASTALSGVLGAGTPAKAMGAGRAKSPASD